MKTTIEENDAVQTLKSLMKSLRDNANYFDEAHEYERMNELDKVYEVLHHLTVITKHIIDAQNEHKEYEQEFGKEDGGWYAIPKQDGDLLIDTIDRVDKMKPFGEKI